ncbi:hypothetical protein JCM3774_002723 [Rhodotorula dairenensis]
MAETRLSSPLSSLTPSPGEHAAGRRPSKRPRLASASPPSPADFVYKGSPGPRTAARGEPEGYAGLLDELAPGGDGPEVADMAPPAVIAGNAQDGGVHSTHEPVAKRPEPRQEAIARPDLADASSRTDEDDSGVAFLRDDDATAKMHADTIEAGAEVEAEVEHEADVEELDFDGDDIWLEFDEADMGFDQPQTFPSSALAPASVPAPAPAPPNRLLASRDLPGAGDATSTGQDAPAEPRLQDFGFANFDSSSGFTFATRKPFVVSEKAMQRARALLDAVDEETLSTGAPDAAATKLPQVPLGMQAGPAKLPTPMRPHSASDVIRTSTPIHGMPSVAAVPSSSPLRPAYIPPYKPSPVLVGFQNAAGRSLKMPSEAAIQRSRNKLEAKSPSPTKGSSTILRPARPRAHSRASPAKDLFAVNAPPGATGPPPTFRLKPIAAALDVNKATETPDVPSVAAPGSPLPRRLPMQEHPGITSSEPSEAVAAEATAAWLATTATAVRDELSAVVSTISPVQLTAASSPAMAPVPYSRPESASDTPLRPLPRRPQVPSAPRSNAPHAPPSRAGGFRPPLLAGQHKFTPSATPSSSRTVAPALGSTPLGALGPATNSAQPGTRRLSFGMTPRAKPFHLANTRLGTPASTTRTGVKAFVTPFKGGKRPDGLTPMGLKDKIQPTPAKPAQVKSGTHAPLAKRTAAGTSRVDVVRRDKAKVFDLEAPRCVTYDLTFGMRPQTHYYEHLEDLGIPAELLSMDSKSGATYVFPCGRGVDAAFATLQELVAERMPTERDLVTLPWVKNHWTLVLWKLASYVRSRPDLLTDWWSFERVMDQLRYRYEREVNRAERPAIKRIQEHDSPASLPMVLCVSQIRWDEPAHESDNAEEHDAALVIAGLELTDGWYRIRANVDRTLKSACERGKIVVGCKVAVAGAKLDTAGGEGTDVLRALNKSQLVISGNSTTLADWHAKLGFSPVPFVAGLASLSPDGGLVPLVDVLIERAFPCGYIDLRRGRGTETWSEEEELTRAEEWKLGRERIEAKLADEMEKETTEEDALVALLQDAAERYEDPPKAARDTPPHEEPDEILDRIESAANKQAVIRRLSGRDVHAVLALAQENAQSSRYRAVEQLQKELAERYPQREVRGFRVLRVVDAREGTKKTQRSAQLTVWDAQSFEAEFFREGQRYMISNLMPKGNWRSTDHEISLATRRDTRWTKI